LEVSSTRLGTAAVFTLFFLSVFSPLLTTPPKSPRSQSHFFFSTPMFSFPGAVSFSFACLLFIFRAQFLSPMLPHSYQTKHSFTPRSARPHSLFFSLGFLFPPPLRFLSPNDVPLLPRQLLPLFSSCIFFICNSFSPDLHPPCMNVLTRTVFPQKSGFFPPSCLEFSL